MVYTDRNELTILELPEERNYVTRSELIPLLTERPSDIVYIERNGKLRGILAAGRIVRIYSEENNQIPFSQAFTYIGPNETHHS